MAWGATNVSSHDVARPSMRSRSGTTALRRRLDALRLVVRRSDPLVCSVVVQCASGPTTEPRRRQDDDRIDPARCEAKGRRAVCSANPGVCERRTCWSERSVRSPEVVRAAPLRQPAIRDRPVPSTDHARTTDRRDRRANIVIRSRATDNSTEGETTRPMPSHAKRDLATMTTHAQPRADGE